MRIVHTEASLGWGGQALRILAEAQGLMRRGHDIRLICPPEARLYTEAPAWGLPAIAAPIGRKRPVGVKCLIEWFRHNRCDVISTHSATDSWLAALAMLVLGRPFPIVRTRHDSAPVARNRWTRWLYTRATARIVTTDEAARRELIERNGYPAGRIDVVPTGEEAAPSGQRMLDEMERIYREASGRPVLIQEKRNA